jgi:tetratricopeptide (TPR) repeat protein
MGEFLLEHNASWVGIALVIGFIIYHVNKFQKERETHDSLFQIVTIQDIIPLYRDENPARTVELVSLRGTKNTIVAKKDLYKQGDKALFIPAGYRLLEIPLFDEYIRPKGDKKKSKLDENGKIRVIEFISYHTGNYNPIHSHGILIPVSGIAQTMNEYFGDINEDHRKYASTHILMGNLKWENGDQEGAIADYKQAIGIEPDNYLAYYYWGDKLRKKDDDGNWSGGEEQFFKIIGITAKIINNNPGDSKAYLFRGRANEYLDHTDDAANDYTKSIEANPNDFEAFQSRGHLRFLKSNDPTGALDDYSHVIEIDSNNHSAYFWRGRIKVGLNDISGAIDDYSSAIEKSLNDLDALFVYYDHRGDAKMQLNNVDGAVQDYLKADEIDPYKLLYGKLYKIYCKLAEPGYHRREYAQAMEAINKAIGIFPDFQSRLDTFLKG